MGRAVRLTDANFEQEVLASGVPVLVDFWASWCPPCKMMDPVIEALAEEYNGRLVVGKVNVDQSPLVRSEYRVVGVPTFILFQGGEPLQRRTGAQSKGQLVGMLGAYLGLMPVLGVLVTGSLLGLAQGLWLMVRGRGGRKTAIPFGPALATAGLLHLFAPMWLFELSARFFGS